MHNDLISELKHLAKIVDLDESRIAKLYEDNKDKLESEGIKGVLVSMLPEAILMVKISFLVLGCIIHHIHKITPRGSFLTDVESYTGGLSRTCIYNYMYAYRAVREFDILKNLPPSFLYDIGKENFPDILKRDIAASMEAGMVFDYSKKNLLVMKKNVSSGKWPLDGIELQNYLEVEQNTKLFHYYKGHWKQTYNYLKKISELVKNTATLSKEINGEGESRINDHYYRNTQGIIGRAMSDFKSLMEKKSPDDPIFTVPLFEYPDGEHCENCDVDDQDSNAMLYESLREKEQAKLLDKLAPEDFVYSDEHNVNDNETLLLEELI